MKFEMIKKQLQKDVRGRNTEKSNITQQQAINQQYRENQITKEMQRKEKKVANKLAEAEQARLLQLELKRERQRLVHEEN